MKKPFTNAFMNCLLAGVSVFFALFVVRSYLGAQEERIVVGCGDSFVPMIFLNTDDEPDGIDVDRWRLWSKKTGTRIVFRLMDWSAVIPSLMDGALDAVNGVSYTEKRAEIMDFSAPYDELHVHIFFHEAVGGIRHLDDLAGFPVGVLRGTNTEEYINREAPTIRLVPYTKPEEMVRAALEGHLRIIVGAEPVVSFFFAKYGGRSGFRRLEKPILKSDLRVAVRKGDTALLAMIEKGFAAINEDEKKALLASWTGVDISTRIPWKWIWIAAGVVFAGALAMVVWNTQLRMRVMRATQTLKDSEDRFRGLVETTSDWIWEVDKNGTYTYASPRVKELLGYTPEEVLGRTPFDFMPVQKANRARAFFSRVVQDHLPFERFENSNLHKKGHLVELETSAVPIISDKGDLLGYRGIDRDMTERKRQERALRESLDRFDLAVQGVQDGVWDVDLTNYATYVSPRYEELLGYEAGEIKDPYNDWLKRLHPDDQKRVLKTFQDHLEKKSPYIIEYRLKVKGGQYTWFSVRGQAVWDEKGKPVRMVGSIRDITERKLSEQALMKAHAALEDRVKQRTSELQKANDDLRSHQERLRSLSTQLSLAEERERRRIAAEVHDHIGQNLAFTKIKLDQWVKTSPSDHSKEVKEAISLLDTAIQDTRTLVSEIGNPVLYELGLVPAIQWLVKRAEEKHRLPIIFEDDGQKKPVSDDVKVFLFQAVRELLTNIAKHAKATTCSVLLSTNEGYFQVDIVDDGQGFDTSEVRNSSSGSMGFGFFSIRERLEPVGGGLHIDSKIGKGTQVTLVAPLSE